MKEDLPVVCRANRKAWVTEAVFEDWLVDCFIPDAKHYCEEKKIPFKILLVIDNTLGHGTMVKTNLYQHDLNAKVIHQPKNTMAVSQPMDQEAISA